MELKFKKEWINKMKLDKIADFLLNYCVLEIRSSKTFRICEIEFYIKSEIHNDEYTHSNEEQLFFSKIYFHKFKNGTPKEGTWKGMDLTFGDKAKNIYFGVLIRSIFDLEKSLLIEGPSKCVSEIIANFGFDKVKEFCKKYNTPDFFEKDSPIILKNYQLLEKEDIFKGPRIGLSDKYPQYKMRDYRYLIMKNKIKKSKKNLKQI